MLLVLLTQSISVHAGEHRLQGIASYYSDYHHGRLTANGERFNMHDLTAAHRTLPLGSKVKVTNLKTGKSVIVKINDRGPYVKGRVIDLSKAAAGNLGILSSGLGQVKIDVIYKPERNLYAKGR